MCKCNIKIYVVFIIIMENNKISGIFMKKKQKNEKNKDEKNKEEQDKEEQEKQEYKQKYERKILSKQEILSSIPQNALDCENINLKSTKTEYRWRILNIENIENEIIEISMKLKDAERLFLNQSGNWIEYNNNNNNNNYDKYVVKSYYYYE